MTENLRAKMQIDRRNYNMLTHGHGYEEKVN